MRRRKLKDQLGHSSIKLTVDVYAHLQPAAKREAVNRLPRAYDELAEEDLEKAGNEWHPPPESRRLVFPESEVDKSSLWLWQS